MKTRKQSLILTSVLFLLAVSAIIFAFRSLNKNEEKSIVSAYAIDFTKGNLEEAVSLAKKENKPLFIMVDASWCPSCKKMKKKVLPEKELGVFYNSHFISTMVDFDSEDGKMLRKQYNVHGTPSFLYLTAEGAIINQTAGFQTKEALIDAAKNLKVDGKAVCN